MVIVGEPLYVSDLDGQLHDMLEFEDGAKQDVVESALWQYFGGRRKSAVEAKIEHKKNRLQAIEQEIESDRQDKREVQEDIRSLEAKLEQIDDSVPEYEADLDDLLDAAEAGERDARIIPATLSDISDRHGESPEQVHEDLKQRAIEQERGIRATAFVQPMHDADVPSGPVADVWGDGDE